MKDNIIEIRDQLTVRLDRLLQNSEKIYLNLKKDYPLLLKELEDSIKNSSDTVETLKKSGCSVEVIDLIIDEGKIIIENFNNSFTSLNSRDGELFDIINRGIREMRTLSDVISNIKEGSIEMELISLNAMTVALKSGTVGRALSFITDELKKLSSQTIRLTDELTVLGKNQLTLYEEFGDKITKTKNYQENLSENTNIYLQFSFITSGIQFKKSAETMSSLRENSSEIKKPLMRMIHELEFQNKIRQSIDHVYIAINAFKAINVNSTTEETLDEISFRKIIPELCFSVLENAKNELLESVHILEENSHKIKSILAAQEREKTDLAELTIESSDEAHCDFSYLKEKAEINIRSLIKDLNNSIRLRQDIAKEGRGLLKDIIALKRQFESFESIITRFHNIIVASRIEVAKQSELRDMEETVSEMIDLTESMNMDITNALEMIKHFLKTTETIMKTYSSIIKREMPGLELQVTRTTDNLEKLNRLSDNLTSSFTDFSIYNKDFFCSLEKTEDNRKKLTNLTDDINEIESLLQAIRNTTDSNLIQFQSIDNNSENWTIKNESLTNIIDKLKIFEQKKNSF